MTERNFKSTTTRCRNKFKKLEESLPELYKKRRDELQNLNYFYSKNDHDLVYKLSIEELNTARASIMLKIAKLDKEIETLCLKMKEQHKKYIDTINKYKPAVVNGFRVPNSK